SVRVFAVARVGIGGSYRSPIPIVSLERRNPSGRVVATRDPTAVNLRRVRLLRHASHHVIRDQHACESGRTSGVIATRCTQPASAIEITELVRLSGTVLNGGVTMDVATGSVSMPNVGPIGFIGNTVDTCSVVVGDGLYSALWILCARYGSKVIVVLNRRSEGVWISYGCRISKGVMVLAIGKGIGISEIRSMPTAIACEDHGTGRVVTELRTQDTSRIIGIINIPALNQNQVSATDHEINAVVCVVVLLRARSFLEPRCAPIIVIPRLRLQRSCAVVDELLEYQPDDPSICISRR